MNTNYLPLRTLNTLKKIFNNIYISVFSVISVAKRFIRGIRPIRVISVQGFTLIELLLVVIIIGALVAMVAPRLSGRGEEARVTAAEVDISSNIATALKLYELDNGILPSTEEGLKALMSKPSSATNWNGPYLEKRPVDPWGREYQYRFPGAHSRNYDLYSLGRDGKEGSDDVTNWE